MHPVGFPCTGGRRERPRAFASPNASRDPLVTPPRNDALSIRPRPLASLHALTAEEPAQI